MKRFFVWATLAAFAVVGGFVLLAPGMGRREGDEYVARKQAENSTFRGEAYPRNDERGATQPRPAQQAKSADFGPDCQIQRSGHWVFGFPTEAAALKWAKRDIHATGAATAGLADSGVVYLDRGEMCERLPCSHVGGLSKIRLTSGSHMGNVLWITDEWTHGQ